MFRFVLQIAFVRWVLQHRLVRIAIAMLFLCCLIAGVIYAALVLKAVNERSEHPHVQHYSVH